MGATLAQLAVVALGGAAGSACRWGLGLALSAAAPGLPAGTFVANVAAGLLIGAVGGAHAVAPLPEELRLLLTVGLCGGLSTFSTFSNETLALLQAGRMGMAAANVVANVAVCLVAVWAGSRLGGALVA